MALPPSPPESPTLEQGPSSADPTSVPPPLASPSSDDTVPSPVPLTPTAIESTPLLASSPQQEATPLAIPSEPVLVNNQSVQLPSDATDSLLLSSTSKPLLRKKKSFLGLGINSKRDLSVSAPAAESSSLRSSKGTGAKEVKKKTSLMGGLLRSLTGKSGTKKVKPSSEQGLLTRGLSVIEDRSEKARVEKEELKQDEAANAEKIKNHVATLLVPASTRPLSGAAPSPSSTLRGQSQSTNARSSSSSPARIGVSTLDEPSSSSRRRLQPHSYPEPQQTLQGRYHLRSKLVWSRPLLGLGVSSGV
ncbi:hypothetical protein BDY24DRAFT_367922 [Mrakia frigida]|uniref:uncharacterized protein n=1 Tax=Mrakia frigida TaxID=29902 RepID=UPI003FCBF9B5